MPISQKITMNVQPMVAVCYSTGMTDAKPLIEADETEAEARALAAAIAESDADPRTVPHEKVRAWLMRLAEGEFDAPPPEAH
jgi:hypothetical protein